MQQYLPFTVLKLATAITATATIAANVATVPTVYGIETGFKAVPQFIDPKLQQYLPFTVLKQTLIRPECVIIVVATVPTVYGIETSNCFSSLACSHAVATVPTVYGIETAYKILSTNL